MKTSKFFFVGLLAVLSLFSVACNDKLIEEESNLRPGARKITITAEFDNAATKAHAENYRWFWDVNDQISILTYADAFQTSSTNTPFTMVEDHSTDIAHFTGTINGFVTGTGNDIETGYIWGMYPYQAQVSLSQGGVIEDAYMPARQYVQRVNSFSKNAGIAAAWSPTFGMTFKNAFSSLAFTIQNTSDIKAVSIRTGLDIIGQPITGRANLTFDGFDLSEPNDKIPHATITEGRPNAILVNEVEEHGFQLTPANTPATDRNYYYINIWPQHVDTLTFILYKENKAGYVIKTKAGGYNFEVNQPLGFQNIDTFVEEWVPYTYEIISNYDVDKPIAVQIDEPELHTNIYKTISPTVIYGPHDVDDCEITYQLQGGHGLDANGEDDNGFVRIKVLSNGQCRVKGLAVTPSNTLPPKITVKAVRNNSEVAHVYVPVYVYNNESTVMVEHDTKVTKVKFAPSNLQAWNSIDTTVNGTTRPAFRFLNKQAAMMTTENLSRPDAGQGTVYDYIDLFGWMTGWHDPNNYNSTPEWLLYSTDAADYQHSLSWAKNGIFNQTTQLFELDNKWKVMTAEEWYNLNRTSRMTWSGSPSTKFVNVVISGNVRPCLAIYPDAYPSHVLSLPDQVNLEDIPEGICLLPICAVREGLSLLDGVAGYYWTRTPGGDGENPYSVKLQANGWIATSQANPRYNGLPVRLVQYVVYQ